MKTRRDEEMRMELVLVTCLLSVMALGVEGMEQKFLVEPVDVVAVEGERVVLECLVENKVGTIQWTKDDFGLGADRDLSGFSRYRMLGTGEKTWNLEINNVTLEDDGRFQCQVGATDDVSPIRSRYATLSVLTPPQPPVITSGPKMILKEGRISMIQCISKGGKPASTVRWFKNGQELRDGVKTKVETMEDKKRQVTVSTLTFTAMRNMSGVRLECEAGNKVENEVRTVSTEVEVEYPPVVKITVDKEVMYEGDIVKVSCNGEASPASLDFQWKVDGKLVEEAREARQLVLSVDRSMNGKKVSCLVRNKIGQVSDDYVLDVKYSPVFVRSPQDVIGDKGDKINLECEVDSNPSPSYLWIRNDLSSEVVGEGPRLSLILSGQTSGRYTCQASVTGFSGVDHTATVLVRGPPMIVGDGEVQYGIPGETVHLSCEAESVPQVERVSWSYQGVVLQPGSQLYSMVETRRGPRVRSTLVIKRSDQRHFGEYGCVVSNNMGETATVIQLRPRDSLPLLIIIAAVIGGLLLTVAVIVIFLTCRRAVKSSSPDDWPPSSDKTQELQPDGVSNTSSDMKTDTRTTSSLSAHDDLDGSDSLPEYHANYIKSQPDLRNTYTNNVVYSNTYLAKQEPGWHGYGNYEHYTNRGYTTSPNKPAAIDPATANYVSYRQYGSENNLLEVSHNTKYNNLQNYSNPYVLSAAVSPDSEYSHRSQTTYSNVPQRPTSSQLYRSGRYNAVAQNLQVDGRNVVSGDETDLNESSIGTHV